VNAVPTPSPNPAVDKELKRLMRIAKTQPPDVAVKIIAQVIAWEKIKHSLKENGEEFNPDNL
jgi:hypothetical protein